VSPEQAALTSWAFEPVPTLGLAVSAVLYIAGWRRVSRLAPRRFPMWRMVSFLGGLAAIGIALSSPLDAFASFFLLAHMVQHMVLTMVAPPLILLGCPQLPILLGLPRRLVADGLGPFLRWRGLHRFTRALMHPMVCLGLFMLSNVVWHIPEFYELALRRPGWHQVEHACFLLTATMFWWHVVQPWPSRPHWPRLAIIPYLVVADLQNTALAAFLSFYERIVYPSYEAAPRLGGLTALADQAAAGAVMWVPGSVAFLVPAGMIAMHYLSPKRRNAAAPPPARPVFIQNPKFKIQNPARLLARGRPLLQATMLFLAVAIILDGLLGPQHSPMNLAGVLPWTHWRAFTVIALLAAGNLFCMACPFTFVRDMWRRLLPPRWEWPRMLRTKYLAAALIVIYLWAYEAFDLWNSPSATALIIVAYFVFALVIDGLFRGASFCKWVCPIGQFHFVQSLASPMEVRVREPDVCAGCKTFDCIKGNATRRGCELELFQPRKAGNMDCTFCLDCVKACPHDNVGLLPAVPAADLFTDPARSSIGRYARRTDLAMLVLVLTFGAFANAAGMVVPVLHFLASLVQSFHLRGDILPVAAMSLITLVALPLALTGTAAAISRRIAQAPFREVFCRFAMTLAPLGFGMWIAHFVFHFFAAALTPVPVFYRVAYDLHLTDSQPEWRVPSWAFYDLPALELLFLGAGFLFTLYAAWRLAQAIRRQNAIGTFLPWATLALALYASGVWIIFQPMEMRGTLSP